MRRRHHFSDYFPDFTGLEVKFEAIKQPFQSVKMFIDDLNRRNDSESDHSKHSKPPIITAKLTRAIDNSMGADSRVYEADVYGEKYAAKLISRVHTAAPDLQIGSTDDLSWDYDFQYLAQTLQWYEGCEYLITLMNLGDMTYPAKQLSAAEPEVITLRAAHGGLTYLKHRSAHKIPVQHRGLGPHDLLFIGNTCFVIDGSSSIVVKSYDSTSEEFKFDLSRLLFALIRPVLSAMRSFDNVDHELNAAKAFFDAADANMLGSLLCLEEEEAQTLLDLYHQTISVESGIEVRHRAGPLAFSALDILSLMNVGYRKLDRTSVQEPQWRIRFVVKRTVTTASTSRQTSIWSGQTSFGRISFSLWTETVLDE
eukprot:TRINITY_DN4741_c0_g1_i1.p1 TRINITY_DN4741_c0_g1~~TRINITY_DN4741_c0_g1_i1.p1  ORF type:complete len:367 (-),score=53.86 TRINITY_DN4741_c0_g1_i1:655-1755(-)